MTGARGPGPSAPTPGARDGEASAAGPPSGRPPGPTRDDAVEGVARELASAGEETGVERPRLEAERLVCHVTGSERAELARTGDRRLTPEEAGRLARATRRRLSGEPLQHIEGTVAFRELVLLADPRAFLPRPETEQLVSRVERWARDRSGDVGGEVRTVVRADRDDPPLDAVLDVGTGSGAIALSLVHEGIARRAVGLDVSSEALMQAAANRAGADLSLEEVELRLASRPVWSSVAREERFDAVVSNPPYVTDEQMEELPAEIADHEPRRALAGGEDGLEVIREIADGAHAYLRPGGALFLEIGSDQGEAVRSLLEGKGVYDTVEVSRDLAGRVRFVRADLTEEGR